MPYLLFSHARYPYVCAECGAAIYRGQPYFRDEPHPWARMRGAEVRKICAVCVLGQEEASSLQAHHGRLIKPDPQQLTFSFDVTKRGPIIIPPRVQLVSVTPQIINILSKDPSLLFRFDPARFEDLVFDRLDHMGLEVRRIGESTFQRDGGVDAVAWPRQSVFPFLLAVQVKFRRDPRDSVGSAPVRDLAGVLNFRNLNAGMIVTNTSFSPDAKWFAAQRPTLLHLRDQEALVRWLRNDFLREREWSHIPEKIELCPGIWVDLR